MNEYHSYISNTMKKILFLIVVALMTTFSVKAQEGYDDTKHEIAISYGYLANSQWIDVYENVATAIVGARYDDEKNIGPLSVEYFYHAKNWLSVGGIFVYGKSSQDIYIGSSKSGELNHSYYTVMPAVKFDWLRKRNFGMYSKLAFGATVRTEDADGESDTALHPNWQVSFLGLEAGSPTVRAFLELGTGEQGLALVGLRYKF